KGSHSTLRDSELPSGFEEVVVEVKTLDTFVRESQEVPDIIKVDIEGAEYDFLLGALETIKKYRPIFYIEIHSEFCAIRCFEILRSEGYSVTIINEEPDNRIMIKAEYIDVKKMKKDSIEVRELQIQRNQDAIFHLLKSITSFIEPIKKDLIILQNENQNLEKRTLELGEKNDALEKRTLELEGKNSALEKRNLELGEKNDALEKRTLELEGKNSALEKRNLELGEKNDALEKRTLELEGKNSALEKRNLELEEKNSALEKKILELGREILGLSTDNVKLKEVISLMEESRSWRITKPLRSVKHVLKKLK
ncbi:FkbM family methyltransferase, partial [Patescibacteria group bacterium]|nr:FkbM family methyltransferase [Patescibacteria group bacterium]